MHACAHRSSTTSQGCASMHSCTSVCAATISLIYQLCVFVRLYMYVRVLMLVYITAVWPIKCCGQHLIGHTAVMYTRFYTHTHTFNTFNQVQYSAYSHVTLTLTSVMKVRQKCLMAGTTTGCLANLATYIEEKQRIRSCRVYSKKKTNKKQIYMHIHMCLHVCMYVCTKVKANQRHTRVTTISKGCPTDIFMSVCVCVLTDVVHAHKSGQPKNKYVNTH